MNITPSLNHLLSEINRLAFTVDRIEKEMGVLRKENQDLKQENQLLKLENQNLKQENQTLKQENQTLKRDLERIKIKKNSNNSHIPPSQDIARKNKSLRQKSDKKQGGQFGHDGHTLKMVDTPDEVKDYQPNYCKLCGENLSQIPAILIGSRQTVEIPPIEPLIIQHNVYRKICNCGYCADAAFPENITAPISYGSSVQGLVSYLHTRQYLPYDRMKEFFNDVLGVSLSGGSLRNMIHRTANKALPYYEEIKNRLLKSSVVGSDETSVKVNGDKNWMWTWQNSNLTFITHSDNRGFDTIKEHFKDGLPNTILLHDRYACHFQTTTATHQICLVHLQRDLQYLNDLYKDKCAWVLSFRNLIKEAMELKKQLSIQDHYQPHQLRNEMEERLCNLLKEEIDHNFKKAISLQKSLRKHQNYILTFLYHPKVPPDNNGSEQAIRNIKVKQKVSGLFRSISGAEDFAILRSLTDTVLKSGQNVLAALTLISNT